MNSSKSDYLERWDNVDSSNGHETMQTSWIRYFSGYNLPWKKYVEHTTIQETSHKQLITSLANNLQTG